MLGIPVGAVVGVAAAVVEVVASVSLAAPSTEAEVSSEAATVVVSSDALDAPSTEASVEAVV